MKELSAACQRTGKILPLRDGVLVGLPRDGSWSFVCKEAVKGEVEADSDFEILPVEGPGEYPIPVAKLLASQQAFEEYVVHLCRKRWFRLADFQRCLEDLGLSLPSV